MLQFFLTHTTPEGKEEKGELKVFPKVLNRPERLGGGKKNDSNLYGGGRTSVFRYRWLDLLNPLEAEQKLLENTLEETFLSVHSQSLIKKK